MLSSSRTSRVRGCDPPYSVEQIGAIFLELTFTSLTLAVLSLYADRPGPLSICLILYLLCFFTVAFSYVYCSCVDPAAPNIDYLFLPTRKSTSSRYCRICSKSIPGLDHHCVWLNTCIGARNYWAFYVLASAGLLQHILQFILCILVATPLAWKMKRTDGSVGDDNGPIFAGIVSALSVIGLVAFGSLWLFHSYLLTQGIGTYDWLLQRAERRAKREEEEERKEDERIRQELAIASERMLAAAETITKLDSEIEGQRGVSSRQEGSSVVVGIESGGFDESQHGILGPRPAQNQSWRLSVDSDDDDNDDNNDVLSEGSRIAGPSTRLSSAAEMRRRERVATLRANISINNRALSARVGDVEFEDSEVPTTSSELEVEKNRLFSTMSTRMSVLHDTGTKINEEDSTVAEKNSESTVNDVPSTLLTSDVIVVSVLNEDRQPKDEEAPLTPTEKSDVVLLTSTVEVESRRDDENKEVEEDDKGHGTGINLLEESKNDKEDAKEVD